MNRKLLHLRSLADAAHAEFRQVADDLRKARDQYHVLDRHREAMEQRGFNLSAPDAAAHADLSAKIDFLAEKHNTLRADQRAKRTLADRCAEVAHGA